MAIMDLHRSDVQTDIQGGVEFSFSKDAASKLYQMMSNYLYSDKEYAVISELAANAVDAHALVSKKNVPISIQLPTRLESEFVVRDYGPGLPEHDVYRFLTSYGESSKGDSNEQIGFWGIGSKSPAAVSDSWSIISHHGGKRSHYEVFITESGIPTLKKIFEGESDETGLEVRVPVPLNSHQQWTNAAIRAFKYYEVRPEFNTSIVFPTIKYSHRGNGWARAEQNSTGGRLLIAMREYPLDFAKVMAEVDGNSPIRKLFGSGWANMDFMFNVGEINLSISREQIQYDKKSIDSIKAKIELAYKEFTAIIAADLDAAENSIDYRKRLRKWYDLGVNSNYLLGIVDGKHGILNIPRDITRVSAPLKDLGNIQVVYGDRMKKVNDRFNCWNTGAVQLDSRWVSAATKYDYTISLNIGSLDQIQVVIRDVRDAVSRIKFSGAKKYNNTKKFFLLVDETPFTSEIPTVLASTFDKPPRDYKKDERGELSGFYALYGSRFLKIDKDRFLEFRNQETTIAVKIGNATTAANDNTVTDKKVQFLISQGWTVVGYKDTAPKKVKTPEEGMKWLLKTMSADPELKKSIEDFALRSMFKNIAGNSAALIACKIKVDSDKWNKIIEPMKPVIEYYDKNQSPLGGGYTSHQFSTWVKLCKLMEVDDKTSGVVNLDPMMDTLSKRYPLLKWQHQNWYTAVQDKDAVIDYIKMIDQKI